ncbi:glycosyltransferase family 2 protein [Marinilactibacillus sp. GCM10026970]|uniref:glycosyltransferase family 2 protein n=1 Tax=Marinilactibacillus sp. GCM10026970 TaxID=3252642 RepID=UPI0036219548
MKNKNYQRTLFLITFFFMTLYLLWRLFFTLPFQEGPFALIMGVLLLASESAAAFGTFELFWRKNQETLIEKPEVHEEDFPHVDVFIATHNESTDLLFKTANACTFMDYPDKSKVHIYLCDDGNRQEVADLAKKLNIHYLGLENNKDAKSGNLNHALSSTDSPLVVTFDSDMIPTHDFLMESVPYFFLPNYQKDVNGVWLRKDIDENEPIEEVGFVQTPQSFYNPDLFQYNLFAETTIPNEQDFFTKEINVMRNSSNSPTYTGSNTVLSRKALEGVGGFPTDTITEDFQTGIRIQEKGYRTIATTKVVANGLAPTSIETLISQRVRWARGVIQSVRNTKIPFNKELPIASRISYMVSHSYWWSFARRIIFTFSPILFALFGIRIAICGFWDLLLFWGPSHLFYSLSMRSLSSATRNQRWSQIIDTILAPYMILPVFMESVGLKQMKFKVTNKDIEGDTLKQQVLYALPHLLLLGLSIAALINFTVGKYGSELFYGSIIIFWLVYNVINLLYAVFFLLGRKLYRKTDRIAAIEPVELHFENRVLNGETLNLSEGGLLFKLDRAEFIPNNKPILIKIKSDRYATEFEGNIKYVKEHSDNWLYGVQLSSITEDNKKQFSQLIYDRMHSLPIKLDVWMTAFDDIINNLTRRIEKQQADKRTLPRILINKSIAFQDETIGTLIDFNYKYARISGLTETTKQKILQLKSGDQNLIIIFEPVLGEKINYRKGQLFLIKNYEQVCIDPLFKTELEKWTNPISVTEAN